MGKKNSDTPDQSMAMIQMAQMASMTQMHNSDNQHSLGMAQVGSQMMQSEGMFLLGSSKISADLSLGKKELNNALDVVRSNNDLRANENDDGHDEKMADIRLEKHRIDVEARSANDVDTTNFFG